jgi:hypothetical protein
MSHPLPEPKHRSIALANIVPGIRQPCWMITQQTPWRPLRKKHTAPVFLLARKLHPLVLRKRFSQAPCIA